MSRYFQSPMAAKGGQSPMNDGFRGYASDRDVFASQGSLAKQAPDQDTPDPGADASPPASSSSQVSEADFDQLADVTYELDERGHLIPESVSVPGGAPKTPSSRSPAKKTTAKKTTSAARRSRRKSTK